MGIGHISYTKDRIVSILDVRVLSMNVQTKSGMTSNAAFLLGCSTHTESVTLPELAKRIEYDEHWVIFKPSHRNEKEQFDFVQTSVI